MTASAYRAVARSFADKYLAENGMEPWTWPEDAAEPTNCRTAEEAAPTPRLANG
jgi:hypothetical protein